MVAYRITVNSWQKARNKLTAHRAGRQRELPGLSPDLVALVTRCGRSPRPSAAPSCCITWRGCHHEIAHETGAPTGTVKARLARGRRALAPLVSEFDDSPQPGAAIAATHE